MRRSCGSRIGWWGITWVIFLSIRTLYVLLWLLRMVILAIPASIFVVIALAGQSHR